jgi:hypothetical protein
MGTWEHVPVAVSEEFWFCDIEATNGPGVICGSVDPRVDLRLGRRALRPGKGSPVCRRPAGHSGCHWGDGWIWDETASRYDSRMRRVHVELVGTKHVI